MTTKKPSVFDIRRHLRETAHERMYIYFTYEWARLAGLFSIDDVLTEFTSDGLCCNYIRDDDMFVLATVLFLEAIK